MFNLRRIRDGIAKTCGLAPSMPSLEALRDLCDTLMVDVTGPQRDALLQRLSRLRRADDLLDLRSSLFDVVSRQRGESVARERLAQLDARINALPRQPARPPRDVWSATVT